MSAEYTPRPDSLAARVATYFRRLPDEELTHKDIALKWDTASANVTALLALSVKAGLLEKDGLVFRAGPNIGRISLTPEAVARSAEPAPKQVHSVTPSDIAAITFDDNVPLVAGPVVSLRDLWADKLRTMRKGQSFSIPAPARSGVTNAATKLKQEGGHFTIRRDIGNSYRVFCLTAVVAS